ncbi:MAG: tetratricopeptide repeat protein [Flavobacteriaceae bacterium]
MATYKKRGSKPKTKVEKQQSIEDGSTTAEVFNTLDVGASRTEQWVISNQKYIFIIIGLAAVLVLGFLGYDKYVKQPSERNAMNDMYTAQKYFNDAVLGTSQDSLFNISLNGADGKYGMLDIIDNYSGTDAANLANYYAGMAYLNMKDYANAITYLNAFSSNDDILGPMAKGGIGDAFVQLEQLEDAYDYYLQAAESKANNFTRPMYLQKAGVIGLKIGKNKQSLEHFNTIKNDFPDSMEAKDVDVFIGKAQALSN